MTGNAKYRQAYQSLIDQHFYATNLLEPKTRNGVGTGNQSDDEMAFMCYYNLLNYERTPALREQYLLSLRWYWCLEEPERCPLFNFIYAALDDVSTAKSLPLPAAEAYLADGVDTLQRIPLDRVLLVVPEQPSAGHRAVPSVRISRPPGWASAQWPLCRSMNEESSTGTKTPGSSMRPTMAERSPTSATFLLPYYLGRYHGFIRE